MGYAATATGRSTLAASLACMLVLAWPYPARAQDAALPQADDFMIEAMVTGVNPATGRDGSTFAVRAYLGAERTRIDLHMPEAEDAYLIGDNDPGNGGATSKARDA